MKCSKCGALNSKTASFCLSCGESLTTLEIKIRSREANLIRSVPPKKGNGKRTKVAASYALIIVAVLIVVGASMIYDSGGSTNPLPISVPNMVEVNNTTSQPQAKAQADTAASGIIHSTANKSNQIAFPQSSNSTSNNTSISQTNETTPSNNTANNTSDNRTPPGHQPDNSTSDQTRSES